MMQSITKQAYEALQAGNEKQFIDICQAAFADPAASEDDLAWLVGNSIQSQIQPGIPYIYSFLERFPDSLHPISILYAGLVLDGVLPADNRFDAASQTARLYLRRVKDAGLLQSDRPEIQDGVAKAFLQLTAVYTEAGARSYSVRVLELGMQLIAVPYWHDVYQQEMTALQNELQQPAYAEQNTVWEQFFQQYEHVQALHDQCVQAGFATLAQRLPAIESQLRFGTISAPLPFEQEVWLVLITQDDAIGLY